MNTELSNTDKLNLFYEELKKLNFKIFPPCINNSYSDFYQMIKTKFIMHYLQLKQ